MRFVNRSTAALAAGAVALLAQSGQAQIIAPDSYFMLNHPDGNQNPPAYGMRLDELYDATGGHDVFTFDFEHPSSAMTLTYDGVSIRMHGVAHGGRDTGSGYAADQYLGLYVIDFTYNHGVGQVPGDDDLWVQSANHINSGTITTPLNHVIGLVDESMGMDHSFQLGNEANDLGHRGHEGVSGWGWMNHSNAQGHVASSDWLFTLEAPVPAPGTLALMGLGAVVGFRRRR